MIPHECGLRRGSSPYGTIAPAAQVTLDVTEAPSQGAQDSKILQTEATPSQFPSCCLLQAQPWGDGLVSKHSVCHTSMKTWVRPQEPKF